MSQSDDGSTQSYAWVVLALSFVTIGVGSGVRQSMVIMFPELLAEFGWSRTALSVAPALAGAVTSTSGLLIGIICSRVRIRVIIAAGAAIGALGLYLCRSISLPWHIYLFYGVFVSAGIAGLGMFPHTIIVSHWFQRRRGAAIGAITAGSGAGVLLFMPLLQTIAGNGGWRQGYGILAITLVALLPFILVFQREAPGRGAVAPGGDRSGGGGQGAYFLRLIRRGRYWFTYLQLLLGPLSTTPVIIHQAALLRGRGVDPMVTAWIVSLYGASLMFGMLAAGLLSDRLGREKAYSIGTVFLLGGCVALLALRSGGSIFPALVYAVLFGFGFGSRPSMDAATASDIFGGVRFGFTFGTLSTALGLGGLIGPILSGAIYDIAGSYNPAILFCMVAVCVATACIWLAAPRRGRELIPLEPRTR